MPTRQEFIEKMKSYPFGCEIPNLPVGMTCLYRALTYQEIVDHRRNHNKSLVGRRTKARFYESAIEPSSGQNREYVFEYSASSTPKK